MPIGPYASLLMGDLGPLMLAMRLAPDGCDRQTASMRAIDGNNVLPASRTDLGHARLDAAPA